MSKYIRWILALWISSTLYLYADFDEDTYILNAIELEMQKQYDKSRDVYLVLYEETNKLEYLREAVLLSSMLDKPSATLQFAQEYILVGGENDLMMHKVFLDCYLKLGLNQSALKEALWVKSQEDSAVINDILGSLYVAQGDFDNAKKEFLLAYERTKNQDILQKILAIYIAKGQNKKALNALDSHIEQYGCRGYFCKIAIDFYTKTKQITKIEKIFEQTFTSNPTIANAQNLILIYTHQKKFQKATQIASQFPLNPQIMLELYIAQEDFLNASLQAGILYKENKNPYYLALQQIYAFESLPNKQDKKSVKNIAHELQKAITLIQIPTQDTLKNNPTDSAQNPYSTDLGFFFNFLGYLMIDYEINPKEGVKYVKKALEISPKNPAYLDSLAWGYYKTKDCDLAREIFAQIPSDEISKEQELKDHQHLINQCKP